MEKFLKNPFTNPPISTMHVSTVILFSWIAESRQIVFPPIVGADWHDSGTAHTTTPGLGSFSEPFLGLTTYANLPYVHCLSAEASSEVDQYDIAVLGAPFDTASDF